MSKEKDFKFHVPVELVKGKDDSDEWQIKGIASTEDQDLQGEIVSQNGLDISALKAGRGLFNWDHQKGPENVLGQIEDADFIQHEGNKALMVKGYLFKNQDRSKAFHNILSSVKKGNGPRVHMSVEGKIMERDNFNARKINKARIDKVALTLDPVNPYTYAELCKSLVVSDGPEKNSESGDSQVQASENIKETIELDKESVEKLLDVAQKALAAGAGYTKAPEARSDGEAMTQESMERDPTTVTYREKKKKNRKEMVKSIIDGLTKAHPNHDPIELAQWVVEAFMTKLKGESRD